MILMMLFFRSTDNGQQSTDMVHFCNIFQLSIFNCCEPWAVSYGLLLSYFCALCKITLSKVQQPQFKVQSSKFKVQSSNNHLTKIRNKSIVILCRCDFILRGGGSNIYNEVQIAINAKLPEEKSQAVLGLFVLSCTIDCYDNYIQNVIFSFFLLKTNDLQNLYIQQVTIQKQAKFSYV